MDAFKSEALNGWPLLNRIIAVDSLTVIPFIGRIE